MSNDEIKVGYYAIFIHPFIYNLFRFTWYLFLVLLILDAGMNLACATSYWMAGYEPFNAGIIFHRWLNGESLILFPNPPCNVPHPLWHVWSLWD